MTHAASHRRLGTWTLSLALTGAVASAQPLPDRGFAPDEADPAAVQPQPPGPRPSMRQPYLGRRGPTDEQWEQASAFMEKHSPFRWRIFQSLDESNRKWRMRNLIWSQYAALRDTAAPEIAKLRVERVEGDDSAFQLAVQLRLEQTRQPGDTSKIDELRRRLEERTKQLVELGLQERRLRIKRLEAALAAQKSGLAADEANQADLVVKRTDNLMRRAEALRRQADSLDAFMEEAGSPDSQPAPKDPAGER